MSDPRLTDPGHACDCIHHDSDHEAPALRAEVERLRAELAAAEALHVKTLDREDDWMKRLGRANARAEAMEALARELMGWLAEWRQPKPKLETIEEDLRWTWDRQARTDAALARAREMLSLEGL